MLGRSRACGRARWCSVRYPHAAALFDLQPTFIRKGAIGFSNRVEMHPQRHCQLPHGWQGLPRMQTTFHTQRAYLIDDLPVYRRGIIEHNA